ncbi:hypothetical protein AMECASPLE_022704 [Ameca splendens]|uniref:Uncharacterized protein n=1 Tax=Ameca splendens TaxID=208324 RepID=A0ABV0YRG8_9TELE
MPDLPQQNVANITPVAGDLVPISSSLRARGGVHPGQVTSPSQGNTQEMKPEYPESTHACTGRTCKSHANRPLESNRGLPCCKATVLPTAPPCIPLRTEKVAVTARIYFTEPLEEIELRSSVRSVHFLFFPSIATLMTMG